MTKANEYTAESALLGSGEWTYRMVHDWAKLPPGWTMVATSQASRSIIATMFTYLPGVPSIR